MIRYLHTICTHLRKIEENKRYYLKRKYYLWAWKSRGMYMKRNRIQIIENQIFATHIWRSLVQAQAGPQTERLILNRMEPFLFADPPDINQ